MIRKSVQRFSEKILLNQRILKRDDDHRALGVFVYHTIAQRADAFGLDLDDIAGLQVARRVEARTGAGRRARHDNVARDKRREGRNIADQIAEREDQPAGAIILPELAIDAGGQANIGNLSLACVRNEPGTKAAAGVEILALRDVE